VGRKDAGPGRNGKGGCQRRGPVGTEPMRWDHTAVTVGPVKLVQEEDGSEEEARGTRGPRW
jgi:hypothetical protein